MQRIKNNLIWIKNIINNILNLSILHNKVLKNIKIIGPSLSILKPEITAIYSILNRIIGIFLLLIIFIIFLPIKIQYLEIFSFFYYNILIGCMFFFFFHIIYNRLKLTLYYNKIYLFINKNIIIINNYIYIYLILILILIFCNLVLLIISYHIFVNKGLLWEPYSILINYFRFFELRLEPLWCLYREFYDLNIWEPTRSYINLKIMLFFFFIKYKICIWILNIVLKKNTYFFALQNYIKILKKNLILLKNYLIWLYWELYKEINIIYICKWKYKLYYIYIYIVRFFLKKLKV
jgi:hypothetical protein